MHWSLHQHSELWGGQESDFLIPIIDGTREAYDFGTWRGDLHWLPDEGVSLDELLRYVGFGVNSLYTNRAGGLRWMDQSPIYTLYLRDTKMLFPGAKFIHMLRDGRSVVHSMRNFVNPFVSPMGHEEAIQAWVEYTTAARAYGDSESAASMITVRYEDVVADTSTQIRRIHEFLEIPFEEASVEFIEARNPINSSFSGEVPAEKLTHRWASWDRRERELFSRIAGDLLVLTGYERDASWVAE